MSNVTRGYSFSVTETVTAAKLHALVDDASVNNIVDADVAAGADIDSSKISSDLSNFVTIAGSQTITGAKTFSASTVFSTPLADTNLAQITTPSKVSTAALTGTVADANLPTLSIAKGGTGQTTATLAINALLPSQATANGKFLTSNGSVASWGTVSTFTPTYFADTTSSSLVVVANTQRSTSESSYTMLKEIVINGSGSVFVSFDLKTNVSGSVYARIYKNGVAVGTERSMSATNFQTFTETISGLVSGDLLQLYAKRGTGGSSIVANLRLYASVMTVNTD